ncbi:MAG: LexA family protein, partial [Dehalococcoidia bacterium]
MLPSLNEHEQRIVKFIERSFRRFHFAPTMEEIGKGAGLSSKDHVSRDLRSVEEKGYIKRKRRISRGIELLFTAEGLPFSLSTVHIPLLGWIVASDPVPVPGEYFPPLDTVELARDIVKGQEGLYALQVKG